ncbi:MAG: polyphenol oxidase family protein [Propionibacteriaceae bacterium]|jgi:YfiH family protein|nr:polyphenol oxidase family protein [Propionibacteriaceae bacterium]
MFITRRELADAQLACTDRDGGVSQPPFDSLNLGMSDTDRLDDVLANFELVRSHLGVRQLVAVAQVHGRDVLTVDHGFRANWHEGSEVGDAIAGQPALPRADALVTVETNVALTIRAADCVPVLLAAPGVVGAAHAGRVGLLAGVLDAVVNAMRQLDAGPITAWIGPHVCAACYEVPAEMAADAWERIPETQARSRQGTPAINLGAGAAAELIRLGCDVIREDPCTVETPTLFSHRRDGPRTGRLAAFIWQP